MFLGIATWILASVAADPDGLLRRPQWIIGFLAAPVLLLTFGAQAIQAVLDAVRRRDSFPIFQRVGFWLDHRGLPIVGLYLAVMVAVILAVLLT